MGFYDRTDAGKRLVAPLAKYKGQDIVVLALPRGGVPVAAPIAAALSAPLDLILVRKIGVPDQPELAMGAVVDGEHPLVVRNEDVIALAGVDEAEFETACERELKEIERRRRFYLGGRVRPDVESRIVIVVDDGVATGATTRAALHSIRARNPKKLVLAVPVAPPDTLALLEKEVDEALCLETPADFGAIGCYYADFRQITDEEVIRVLDRFGSSPVRPAQP